MSRYRWRLRLGLATLFLLSLHVSTAWGFTRRAAQVTKSRQQDADDDDFLGGLDDDNPIWEQAGNWAVMATGTGCYTATQPLQNLGLRMCPITSEKSVLVNGTAYAWVNGTVTNVGKVMACGFSFTSLDADLTKAISTFPPNLPVTETVDLGPGEVLVYAFLLPVDQKTNEVPFVSMSNDVLGCVAKNMAGMMPNLSNMAGGLLPGMQGVDKATTMSGTDKDKQQVPASTQVPQATPKGPRAETPAPTPKATGTTPRVSGMNKPIIEDTFLSTTDLPDRKIGTTSPAARNGLPSLAVALVAALVAMQQLAQR